MLPVPTEGGWMEELLRQQTHHPSVCQRERETRNWRGRERNKWKTVRGWRGGRAEDKELWFLSFLPLWPLTNVCASSFPHICILSNTLSSTLSRCYIPPFIAALQTHLLPQRGPHLTAPLPTCLRDRDRDRDNNVLVNMKNISISCLKQKIILNGVVGFCTWPRGRWLRVWTGNTVSSRTRQDLLGWHYFQRRIREFADVLLVSGGSIRNTKCKSTKTFVFRASNFHIRAWNNEKETRSIEQEGWRKKEGNEKRGRLMKRENESSRDIWWLVVCRLLCLAASSWQLASALWITQHVKIERKGTETMEQRDEHRCVRASTVLFYSFSFY